MFFHPIQLMTNPSAELNMHWIDSVKGNSTQSCGIRHSADSPSCLQEANVRQNEGTSPQQTECLQATPNGFLNNEYKPYGYQNGNSSQNGFK